jgi:hypothetical protein
MSRSKAPDWQLISDIANYKTTHSKQGGRPKQNRGTNGRGKPKPIRGQHTDQGIPEYAVNTTLVNQYHRHKRK